MGIAIGFLLVAWLVACVAARGLSKARDRLTHHAGRLQGPSAMPAPTGGVAPAQKRTLAPDGFGCVPLASPTLADIEFPAREPEGPSMEGRLVAALLAGEVSPEHYHKAMHVLAARDERSHPLPPVPS